ncbi:MAG: hypothetical protein M3R59_05400, partial [Verrucomicrobiota bacterium]|nr:hypothetical protein [Verrucomicrobiota bacterium]
MVSLVAFLPIFTWAQSKPSPTASASVAPEIQLEQWLLSDSLWQTTPEKFPNGRALGFRWVSNTYEAARASSHSLRLGQLPVAEVIARFAPIVPANAPPSSASISQREPIALASVQLSIYNRGDSGDLTKVEFDDLVAHSKLALTRITNVSPIERGTDNGSAVQSQGLIWATPASRFLLEWSDTPANQSKLIAYRAEFIRLRVTPQSQRPKTFFEEQREKSMLAAGASQARTVRAAELPARVLREPDGTECIPDIPMVDQGAKGYCVTAATERVLRYYGVEVDQNELAQIADADARRGTNPEVMVDALKKLASRFRVQVYTEYRPTYADF